MSKFILPIFSGAAKAKLGEEVELHHINAFTDLRELEIGSLYSMSAFSHDTRARPQLESVRMVNLAFGEKAPLEDCRRIIRRLHEAEREIRLELVNCPISAKDLQQLRECMYPWQLIYSA